MNIVRVKVFTKRLDLEKGFQHLAGTVHRNGRVVVPEGPGIGLAVREADLTREFEVA